RSVPGGAGLAARPLPLLDLFALGLALLALRALGRAELLAARPQRVLVLLGARGARAAAQPVAGRLARVERDQPVGERARLVAPPDAEQRLVDRRAVADREALERRDPIGIVERLGERELPRDERVGIARAVEHVLVPPRLDQKVDDLLEEPVADRA